MVQSLQALTGQAVTKSTHFYGESATVTSLELKDDPVYQRHREDWLRYHTRYVTPRTFVNGLRSRN